VIAHGELLLARAGWMFKRIAWDSYGLQILTAAKSHWVTAQLDDLLLTRRIYALNRACPDRRLALWLPSILLPSR
jgi:hypothetical protein